MKPQTLKEITPEQIKTLISSSVKLHDKSTGFSSGLVICHLRNIEINAEVGYDIQSVSVKTTVHLLKNDN